MKDLNSLSRRRLVKYLAAASVLPISSLAAPSPHFGAHPRRSALPWVPGLQLYTLGLNAQDDIGAALHAVAKIGFRLVEFAGHYGHKAEDLRRMLDDAGLEAPGAHLSATPSSGNWDFSGDLSKLAADMHTLGVRYVILPMPLIPDSIAKALSNPPQGGYSGEAVSHLFDSLQEDDWRKTAEFLDAKASVLARDGLRVGYHNHGIDFTHLPSGQTGFDILMDHTDPKLVDFEVDIGWAVSAGQRLDTLFHRIGTRLRLLHLKDAKNAAISSMEFASADAGTGIVDFKVLADLVRHSAVQYMFVEHEPPYEHPRLEVVSKDYAYLADVLGVRK